jgi:hypothetical protein
MVGFTLFCFFRVVNILTLGRSEQLKITKSNVF